MNKKWYVGSNKVFQYRSYAGKHSIWAKDSLEEATKHAKEILEKDDSQDEVFIVEIVRVVRKQRIPLVIEDVE